MSNIKKPSIKTRLKALEAISQMKLIEGVRLEVIEKGIQELYDKYEIIEKELIKPLQELQRQSKSDNV